jgi:hypothetical protein
MTIVCLAPATPAAILLAPKVPGGAVNVGAAPRDQNNPRRSKPAMSLNNDRRLPLRLATASGRQVT